MRIDKPYLNLPVRPGAPFVWVNWERPDGSLLYEFYVEDDYVHVVCSPCVRIYINGERRQYQRKLGRHVTEFVTKLKGNEKLIRAECMDAAGRSAYSNPIFFD